MTRLSSKRLERDRERRVNRYETPEVTENFLPAQREWFTGQTVQWLYDEAKSRGCKVTTKMRKGELVEMLMKGPE